ncbi:MAG: glycosyltransferase [Phycisphaerales bacterium JB039]
MPDTADVTTPDVKTMPIKITTRRPAPPPPVRRMLKGLGRWPFVAHPQPLPATMPDGTPWPRITVVTPSYNQGRYIEETILSIRNQGYPNLEHIIMDGGSTDETMAIVEKYRDGIAIAVSEKDKGQSDAINKGMKLATGEILTWINSDDMLAPGALAAAAMAFHTSGADFVNGVAQIFRDGKLVHQCINSCADGPIPLRDLLDLDNCWMKGQFWWQPDSFFTRDLWERAGGHVRVDWYYSMDYELWLRFAEVGAKLHSIGRPVCWYRTHEDQKTSEDGGGGFQRELPHVVADFIKTRGLDFEPGPAEKTKGRLRVVFFNDIGYAYGAGVAQKRLMEAFASAGHEVIGIAASSVYAGQCAGQATVSDIVGTIAAREPDLVVVGNLHGADLGPEALAAIGQRFETVFVMHDLWLLTGRATYIGRQDGSAPADLIDAEGWGDYPRVPANERRRHWEAKRRLLTGRKAPGVVTNSRAVLDLLRQTLDGPMGDVDGGSRPGCDFIKYGLDIETFRPRDRRMCRELLGLPQDDFIVLTSACSLVDERKGVAHLAEAMGALDLPDALVVGIGWFDPKQPAPIPNMRAMGYIDDPQQMAMLYSAADVFVGPSLEEAFGQVFVEAAACGTPAIGYPVGGVPEAITHGVTGLVAREVSPEALAEVIATLHADEQYRRDLGRWARIHIENEWSTWAAYQRFHVALRSTGLGQRIGLSRKIDFTRPGTVPEVQLVRPTMPPYQPLEGFGPEEGDPSKGARFRWMLGPRARFAAHVDFEGRGRLIIRCRTLEQGQRLRVMRDGQTVGEQAAPAGQDEVIIALETTVRKGANAFELHAWKWRTIEGRDLAAQIVSINLVPEA